MDINSISYNLLNSYNYWYVALTLISLFAILYLFLSISIYYISNWSLKYKLTVKVDGRQLFKNQIPFEILHSIMSIIVFSLYGLLIVFSFRNNYVEIGFKNNSKVVLDLLILMIWNEFHFYFLHKLMHSKLFQKIHKTHHKSIVVTPFSTYSFHPIESLIFGTVLIIPMLFFKFELMSIILFPIIHLTLNTLGHSNVKLKSKANQIEKIQLSTNHNNHHTKFNTNFGFALPFLDQLFKTYYKKKH